MNWDRYKNEKEKDQQGGQRWLTFEETVGGPYPTIFCPKGF